MGSLMEKGGLSKKQIVKKLSMSFGANGASTVHMSFITYFSLITINSKLYCSKGFLIEKVELKLFFLCNK